MRMAIDEHHQHKDVYQHSLTVLRQAIELEDSGQERSDSGMSGPDLVLRWAALLHDIGKPAHPQARVRRRRELPPPRGGRRQDGPQADAGAEVLQADGRRRLAAGLPASAVPRLRRRQVDRLGGAPLRHRRRARCCPGCTSWCAPTAPPATSAGRRGCRPTTTTSRRGSPSWPPRRTSRGCGRTSTATRSCGSSTSRRARRSARRGTTSRSCGWTADRSSHDEAVAELLAWWNAKDRPSV